MLIYSSSCSKPGALLYSIVPNFTLTLRTPPSQSVSCSPSLTSPPANSRSCSATMKPPNKRRATTSRPRSLKPTNTSAVSGSSNPHLKVQRCGSGGCRVTLSRVLGSWARRYSGCKLRRLCSRSWRLSSLKNWRPRSHWSGR